MADKLRRGLIGHFMAPFTQDEERVDDLRKLCESPFERELYDELTQRGYWVTPQVRVGQYRIDMVVEGHNDARLAIECDGDRFHPLERLPEDMARQAVLERLGWTFVPVRGSQFLRDPNGALEPILGRLKAAGIEPVVPGGSEEPATAQEMEVRDRIVKRAQEIRRMWRGEGPADAGLTQRPTPRRSTRRTTSKQPRS